MSQVAVIIITQGFTLGNLAKKNKKWDFLGTKGTLSKANI